MLRLSTAAVAILAMAGTARAQATAGDQGSPGTSVNRGPAGAVQPGVGSQGTATNNFSGKSGTERVGLNLDERTAAPPASAPRADSRSVSSNIDSNLADCLILSNQEEIAILRFGMQRTQNDKIKSLAQAMIGDHEKGIEKLRKFASRTQSDLVDSGAGDRRGTTREALKVPGNESGSADAKEEKMNRLAHKMAQECLSLTKEELSQYKGIEFDQAFVGQQCGAHLGMLAKLAAIQSEASQEFVPVAAELRETTKMHKDHLKKLMDSIKDKDSK